MTMITADNVQQAGELIQRGHSTTSIAASWGVSASALYKALKRHNIDTTRTTLTPTEHLDMQAESGTPPELYAMRAGLAFNTIRRYAWDEGRKLAMNTQAERKAYWTAKIDRLDISSVKTFAELHMLPVPMLAQWYHKIVNPSALLLWGFNQLLVVDGDQFRDVGRYAHPRAELFALGLGKLAVPVDTNIAGEVFKFTRPYQHH